MPRVTRATLRSNTEGEEPTALPRRIFGEITGNSLAQQPEAPALIELPLKAEEMPPKKAAGKGKVRKAKGGKKPKKAVENAPRDTTPEVLEDDHQSNASDAADEACENLRSEEQAKGILHISLLSATCLRYIVIASTPDCSLEFILTSKR